MARGKKPEKRVTVKVVEATIGRKRLAILLVRPSERMSFPVPDETVDKLFARYKAGVFIAYRLFPKRRRSR